MQLHPHILSPWMFKYLFCGVGGGGGTAGRPRPWVRCCSSQRFCISQSEIFSYLNVLLVEWIFWRLFQVSRKHPTTKKRAPFRRWLRKPILIPSENLGTHAAVPKLTPELSKCLRQARKSTYNAHSNVSNRHLHSSTLMHFCAIDVNFPKLYRIHRYENHKLERETFMKLIIQLFPCTPWNRGGGGAKGQGMKPPLSHCCWPLSLTRIIISVNCRENIWKWSPQTRWLQKYINYLDQRYSTKFHEGSTFLWLVHVCQVQTFF